MATIRAKSSHIVLVLRRYWVSRTARKTAGNLVVAGEGAVAILHREETRSGNQRTAAPHSPALLTGTV